MSLIKTETLERLGKTLTHSQINSLSTEQVGQLHTLWEETNKPFLI